ncbi:AAA family ATPase [Streptomyces flavidovirens]|uniref:AAA family ATPase n=1 Tax=Streptomyces flavidovirens TaxID=67298 RepID=UPI00042066C7|nr:AAA family ATPase [Streptomyces flavidovirens]
MSAPEVDAEILRRHFVAIATGHYDAPQWDQLPVDDEVQALRDWLCSDQLGDRRFSHAHPELADNPDRHQIRETLEQLPWRSADAAVVFITGHGELAEGAHWIVLRQTEPGLWHRTALRTADVVGWLKDTGVEHLLLIVDLCHAGNVTAQTAVFDHDIPPSWLVLPSAAKDQRAVPRALTDAVTAVLAELATPEGERYGRHNRLLDVALFLEAVQDKLGDHQRLIPLPGSQSCGPHVCLPNPHYRPQPRVKVAEARSDLALPQADVDAHWEPRSRGVAQVDDPGWLFTGRARLMTDLTAAAQSGSGTVLVTGRAGTGKSAALARLVTLADPAFRTAHQAHIDAIPDGLKPSLGAVDVAVLATGKTAVEIAHQISGGLGVQPPSSTDPHLQQWATAWQNWLARRRAPVTVVIDAVDEGDDPHHLLRHLLTHLSAGSGQERLRLILGVRSPSGPDHPAAPRQALPLADLIEQQLRARRLRVDEAPWFDPNDLGAYAVHILTQSPASPYARASSQAEPVARKLAAHAQRSFLLVRLAAASLARKPHLVTPDDPDWLRMVDDGIRGVFRSDLHLVFRDPLERLRTLHLLRALAFARGHGLPWNRIWPAVADAVADDPNLTIGDSDIARLLGSPLSGYLTTDIDDETTVYRLFHDALRTTLRDHWHTLDDISPEPRPAATALENHAAESRIAHSLAHLAGRALDTIPPRSVAAYIRRHLADHASDGHTLNDRVLAPRLLPHLDIARLRTRLNTPAAALSPHTAALLRRVTHLWTFDRPQDNATTLNLWAATLGAPLRPGDTDSSWATSWVHWPLGHSEILGCHGGIRAVAGVVLPDGQVLVLAGGDNGAVRVWDLVSGQPALPPLTGHGGGVSEMAGLELPDGRALALVGCRDGTVHVWNLIEGQPASHPLSAPGLFIVHAVAGVVLPDGRALVLAAGDSEDHAVHVWDLDSGQPLLPPLTGALHSVRAVAGLVLPDGRPLAFAGDTRGTVMVWNLDSGRPALPPLKDPDGWVSELAGLTLPDGRALALASSLGKVLVWDLQSGCPALPPLDDVGMATGLVLPDGRTLAITACQDDATIHVWDLDNGQPALPPLTGHEVRADTVVPAVRAVTGLALPDGRGLAITGGHDTTVRVWDLSNSQLAQWSPAGGYSKWTYAVAGMVLPDGRALALVGGDDDMARVLDVESGQSTLPPMAAQGVGGVRAVASLVLPDGRSLGLVGSGRTVRAWDLDGGRPVLPPLYPAGWLHEVEGVVLPDERAFVLTLSDHIVQVWNPHTGKPALPPLLGMGGLAAVVLPDGRALAITGAYRTVQVWDLDSGKPALPALPSHSLPQSVAGVVLPDGRALALVCDDDGTTVQVWDLSSGQHALPPLIGNKMRTVVGAVLPSGRALALAGSLDNTVRVWDLKDGRLISVIHTPGHVAALSTVLLQDGRLALLIGGAGGSCAMTTDL